VKAKVADGQRGTQLGDQFAYGVEVKRLAVDEPLGNFFVG
jgi:hypothetical protein